MTIRHLKIFVAVVECGSMSAAANTLFITQPTISQAISELEKHYGVILFERLSQKLYITEEGEKLLSYARHIISSYDNMENSMLAASKSDKIHIGCSVSVGTALINDILNTFNNGSNEYDVSIVVDNTSKIEEMVLSSKVDIGLVEGTIEAKDVVKIPVFEDELVVVCGKKHSLVKAKNLTLKDLEVEDFISREKGSYERNQFEILLKNKGIKLNRKWNCSNTEAIKNAVINNRGISVLSTLLLNDDNSRKNMVKLNVKGLPIKRTINLIYHKNKFISESLEKFIEICKEYKSKSI